MFKISVGSSTHTDTAEAVGALIAQCLARFGSGSPKAGLLFNHGHAQDGTILQAIHDTWPDMPLIGNATASDGGEPRLTLMLLDSPDLSFEIGTGRDARSNPALAAEQALSQAAAGLMDKVLLCLTLPDRITDWHQRFAETVARLLPPGTALLNELLPFDGEQEQAVVDRYYCGQRVMRDAVPLLIAVSAAAKTRSAGWSLTRQQGIVRRTLGEKVYEYDTLIGDRRRSARV